MEDYLSEQEQWEWLKAQVRENGLAVLAAIVIALGAVFGWRWWQAHLDTGRLAANAKYMSMVQALESGDRSQALVQLGTLEREHPESPYTDQARLLAGRVYVDNNELDKAAAELAQVSEHSKDRDLAQIARLRLARVQISQGKSDAALATLGDLAGAGAFAARYHEVRGDALFAKGDKAGALSEYHSAQAADPGTDTELLSLKVADLASAAPPGAPAAQPAPAAAK